MTYSWSNHRHLMLTHFSSHWVSNYKLKSKLFYLMPGLPGKMYFIFHYWEIWYFNCRFLRIWLIFFDITIMGRLGIWLFWPFFLFFFSSFLCRAAIEKISIIQRSNGKISLSGQVETINKLVAEAQVRIISNIWSFCNCPLPYENTLANEAWPFPTR